jgi:hypothetical protein
MIMGWENWLLVTIVLDCDIIFGKKEKPYQVHILQ